MGTQSTATWAVAGQQTYPHGLDQAVSTVTVGGSASGVSFTDANGIVKLTSPTLAGGEQLVFTAATTTPVSPTAMSRADYSATRTITAADFSRWVRGDATGGAFAFTLPASAAEDTWVGFRKSDTSANRVTVKNNGGTDVAWLSAAGDEVVFVYWDGAWVARDWRIADLIQVFTTSGTWTKPPLAQTVEADGIGPGGGGGSGRKGAASTIRTAGAGASSGTYAANYWPASTLGASETVTIGTPGAGAASVTAVDTNGNAGAGGTDTTFGSWLRCPGGPGGTGGTTAAAGPLGFAVGAPVFGGTGGTSQAAGGAGNSGNSGAQLPIRGGGGGGSGGGVSSANVASAGGVGGIGSGDNPNVSAAATAGAVDAAGAPGTDVTSGLVYGGGGGAGGGGSLTTNGGGGGAGAKYGGGGGGGGAVLNTSGNSGAGGNGGASILRVRSRFS